MKIPNLILIIEDSADDALIARQSLTKAGFTGEIVHLDDARTAVAYLLGDGVYADRATFPLPQAILLDLKMPEMDGFEFLQWIRTQPDLHRILIVVLTRLEEVKNIQLAYSLGAHSFLTKGADLEEVRNVVGFLNDYARMSAFPPGKTSASGKQERL